MSYKEYNQHIANKNNIVYEYISCLTLIIFWYLHIHNIFISFKYIL